MALSEQERQNRYSRQILFDPIGEEGQRRLGEARVLLVGCGALGSVVAETLVRAGVGKLELIDRDYLELNNLQRQVLFDEDDLARNLPKAIAAAEKLRRINSSVEVSAQVKDVNPDNIEALSADFDLVLDGTDNFETRYLINDLSIKSGKPWVYGAVIGATGLVMPILPGETACLRCAFESAPPPEMSPTCDTAGVISPAVNVVASMQCVEAIKLLIGKRDAVSRKLASIDVWSGRTVHLTIHPVRGDNPCICCGQREFEYLSGKQTSSATTLCGRDAVQIRPPAGTEAKVDFESLAKKLAAASIGGIEKNRFLLRAQIDGLTLTVFPDGRAIIKGTKRAEEARAIYAKYIGH